MNIEPNDEGEAGDLSVAANMHDEDEYDGNEITTEMEQQLGLSLARGV